ncbi:MAG: DUF3592 domain-containing protein [Verrucomicrobiales bacterium]|nr:DUF3592 domain-containing protein [Verrucomicrobiales bacterium]
MTWLKNRYPAILLYGIFLFSFGLYLRGHIVYHDVETWPSVPARDLSQKGDTFNQSSYGRNDPTNSQVDTRAVSFEYEVDGTSYIGSRASADSRGISYARLDQLNSASYKPSNPEIAVLVPTPFTGATFLMISVISGLLVTGHLYFTIRLRERKSRR